MPGMLACTLATHKIPAAKEVLKRKPPMGSTGGSESTVLRGDR